MRCNGALWYWRMTSGLIRAVRPIHKARIYMTNARRFVWGPCPMIKHIHVLRMDYPLHVFVTL